MSFWDDGSVEAIRAALERIDETVPFGPWSRIEVEAADSDGELRIAGTSEALVGLALQLLWIACDPDLHKVTIGRGWIQHWSRDDPKKPTFGRISIDKDDGLSSWEPQQRRLDLTPETWSTDWRSTIDNASTDSDPEAG